MCVCLGVSLHHTAHHPAVAPGTDWLRDRWQAASDMSVEPIHHLSVALRSSFSLNMCVYVSMCLGVYIYVTHTHTLALCLSHTLALSLSLSLTLSSYRGGTAIPGHHWVQMDFPSPHLFDQVILDWETAYATAYRIEARRGRRGAGSSISSSEAEEAEEDAWVVLYDGTLPPGQQR